MDTYVETSASQLYAKRLQFIFSEMQAQLERSRTAFLHTPDRTCANMHNYPPKMVGQQVIEDSLSFYGLYGEHRFRYSICLRLRETRIGIIVPSSITGFTFTEGSSNAYPIYNEAPFPFLTVNAIANEGLLIDHIFTDRLLLTANITPVERDALVTGIVHEFIHINACILDMLERQDIIVDQNGIFAGANQTIIFAMCDLNPHDLALRLKIPSVRVMPVPDVYRAGEKNVMIVVPTDALRIEEVVEGIKAAGGTITSIDSDIQNVIV